MVMRPKARSQTSFESCFLVAAWKMVTKDEKIFRCDMVVLVQDRVNKWLVTRP